MIKSQYNLKGVEVTPALVFFKIFKCIKHIDEPSKRLTQTVHRGFGFGSAEQPCSVTKKEARGVGGGFGYQRKPDFEVGGTTGLFEFAFTLCLASKGLAKLINRKCPI